MTGSEGRGVLDALRPKSFRGDVIAAGVVVLTTLVWVLAARFDDAWADGVHLAYAALALAFVVILAVLAPMEGVAPRAYQSVLYVASVALFVKVVISVADLLGDGGTGTPTCALVAISAFALTFATRRNSAACTLLGAVAGGAAVLAAVNWAWDATGLRADRWVLLGVLAVFGFAAVGQRDRRPRHAVALVDAAGLTALTISGSFLLDPLFGFFAEEGDTVAGAAWGWELLTLAVGFGLIAYSSVDRQPGPAYLGVLNLIVFAIITSLDDDDPTLLGWPLLLALAAGLLLVVGLRPTTPAPPSPDVDAPEPPPLPLR